MVRKATLHKIARGALVLAVLTVIAWQEARGEVSIEIGPTFLSGDFAKGGAFVLSETFADRWAVHLGYISEQQVDTCPRPDCHFEMPENLFAGVQRTFGWHRVRLGIGIDYFQNENRALGCRFTAGLLGEFRMTDRLSLRARHNSNAGSCSPNLGQDFIGFGWTF